MTDRQFDMFIFVAVFSAVVAFVGIVFQRRLADGYKPPANGGAPGGDDAGDGCGDGGGGD